MSKWARKTDKNHQEIRDALRELGFSVADTHRLGGDFPDLVVSSGHDCPMCEKPRTVLVEVKSNQGKPKPGQATFADNWQGECVVAYTLDDVLQVFDS